MATNSIRVLNDKLPSSTSRGERITDPRLFVQKDGILLHDTNSDRRVRSRREEEVDEPHGRRASFSEIACR